MNTENLTKAQNEFKNKPIDLKGVEAGLVFERTGLTPKELAKQNAELIDVLNKTKDHLEFNIPRLEEENFSCISLKKCLDNIKSLNL